MTQTRIVTPFVCRSILILLVVMLAVAPARFVGSTTRELVDFDAFYLAGRLAVEGKMAEAYVWETFLPYQQQLGSLGFMPWAYPPPFNLIVGALALLPLPLGFLVFIGPTLFAYIVVLRRLAGETFPFVLAASFPAIAITLLCGQNGFLTASLIGFASLGIMNDRSNAGVPLGLMIIKPHLAIPIGVFALVQARWRVIVTAGATAVAALVLATLVFGASIWPAYLNGAEEAKGYLLAGLYPLYRMISVYASLHTLGVPAAVGLVVQGLCGLLLLMMVGIVARSQTSLRRTLGIAVMACPFISPYAYDYDTCICGVALALLMPDLQRAMPTREQIALMVLFMLGGGAGMLGQLRYDWLVKLDLVATQHAESIGAVFWIMAGTLMWRALRREAATAAQDAGPGLQRYTSFVPGG